MGTLKRCTHSSYASHLVVAGGNGQLPRFLLAALL